MFKDVIIKKIIFLVFFFLCNCGYELITVNNQDLINISFKYKNDKSDINKQRIYKKLDELAIIENAQLVEYICNINNVTISNSMVAINSTGDSNNYKLSVKINYALYDLEENMIDEGLFDFTDIYAVDQSLYSSEVKLEQMLAIIPSSFNEYLQNQILLR